MDYDAIVIGGGPSGAVCSALLQRSGQKVLLLEKTHFPRFVIGESLLPACMPIIESAGLSAAFNHVPPFQKKLARHLLGVSIILSLISMINSAKVQPKPSKSNAPYSIRRCLKRQ
ncbi:NAD(P)-binding protein [Suttonella sp. R2A3]|nr:NAD(P)-binding protein [Suttonella sp. R2A3]UJF23670.1 NAD(P)-binding protein [Suttonella sp. R2A3]